MRTIITTALLALLCACGPPPANYRPPTVVNVYVDQPAGSTYERQTVSKPPVWR